jgi:hypothetical protein
MARANRCESLGLGNDARRRKAINGVSKVAGRQQSSAEACGRSSRTCNDLRQPRHLRSLQATLCRWLRLPPCVNIADASVRSVDYDRAADLHPLRALARDRQVLAMGGMTCSGFASRCLAFLIGQRAFDGDRGRWRRSRVWRTEQPKAKIEREWVRRAEWRTGNSQPESSALRSWPRGLMGGGRFQPSIAVQSWSRCQAVRVRIERKALVLGLHAAIGVPKSIRNVRQ